MYKKYLIIAIVILFSIGGFVFANKDEMKSDLNVIESMLDGLINRLQSSGGTTQSPPVPTVPSTFPPDGPPLPDSMSPGLAKDNVVPSWFTFTHDLKRGSVGDSARFLQIVLNMDPATQVANAGPGSPGNESRFFGWMTHNAVMRFQMKYASEILHPIGLTYPSGYVGRLTRAKLNAILRGDYIITPSERVPLPSPTPTPTPDPDSDTGPDPDPDKDTTPPSSEDKDDKPVTDVMGKCVCTVSGKVGIPMMMQEIPKEDETFELDSTKVRCNKSFCETEFKKESVIQCKERVANIPGVNESTCDGLVYEITVGEPTWSSRESGEDKDDKDDKDQNDTPEKTNPCQGSSTLTDNRDRKTYLIVEIGSQCWMAESLNYSIAGSWCYNGEDKNCEDYGRLYNFDTAREICPTGWKLPSDVDFRNLERTLGMEASEVEKTGWRGNNEGLKIKSDVKWDGNNDSRFSALPGGAREEGGIYTGLEAGIGFWTSTGVDNSAWSRHLHTGFSRINRLMYAKGSGLYVRCVKN